MSQFWRDGHWRYRDGNEHWVTGHWVDRTDWTRFSFSRYLDDALNRLREARVGYSVSARYVNPNAVCPVCNAPVFFYQNEVGSRVYFDELGPPWPKHPCTDNHQFYKCSIAVSDQFPSPSMRSEEDISEITGLLDGVSSDLESEFCVKYGARPWSNAVVIYKIIRKRTMILVTEGYRPKKFRMLLAVAQRPRNLNVGTVLAIDRGKIAYVDPSSLDVREFNVRPVKSLRAFLELV